MTKTFFTSDIHVFHKRIVELTNRHKDTTAENHTDWLVDLWNSQVKQNDVVWHLGDFAFTSNKNKLQDLVSRLNGNIHFIYGNHCDVKTLEQVFYDTTNKNIWSMQQYKEIKIQGNKVVLFHFPIAAWHKQHYGAWHLHGHSHGSYKAEGKILDVGLDSAYNILGEHRFFTEEDIVNIMATKMAISVDHHTIKE